jgi:hypothetical protein
MVYKMSKEERTQLYDTIADIEEHLDIGANEMKGFCKIGPGGRIRVAWVEVPEKHKSRFSSYYWAGFKIVFV